MSVRYLREIAERALKTFCQTLVAILSAGAVDLISAPWIPSLAAAGFAALLSVLTSVASAPFGAEATPSLVRTEEDT